MGDDTITIIQDQFVYEQTIRGGDWYTYNFNTSYLNKTQAAQTIPSRIREASRIDESSLD